MHSKPFECNRDCLPEDNSICSHLFTPACQLLRSDDEPQSASPTSSRGSNRTKSPSSLAGSGDPAVVVEYSNDSIDTDADMLPSSSTGSGSSLYPQDIEMSYQLPSHSRAKAIPSPPSTSDVGSRGAASGGAGSAAGPSPASNPDDDILAGPDIAMKLYRILEEGTFKAIVSWAPKGDRFIIHDAAEFTKAVLPKLFRHSNFSSFVRQLNKYDFHKVKNAEGSTRKDCIWTFKHQHFRVGHPSALSKIVRKATGPELKRMQTQAAGLASAETPAPSSKADYSDESPIEDLKTRLQNAEQMHELAVEELNSKIAAMESAHEAQITAMQDRLRAMQSRMEATLQASMSEVKRLQASRSQHDALIRGLMESFLTSSDQPQLQSLPFSLPLMPPMPTSNSKMLSSSKDPNNSSTNMQHGHMADNGYNPYSTFAAQYTNEQQQQQQQQNGNNGGPPSPSPSLPPFSDLLGFALGPAPPYSTSSNGSMSMMSTPSMTTGMTPESIGSV